jgi:DNA replication protein DnaC
MNNDLERMIFGPDKRTRAEVLHDEKVEAFVAKIVPRQTIPIARPIPSFAEVPEFAGGDHECKGVLWLKTDVKTGQPWVCDAKLEFPGICRRCGDESTRREWLEELRPAHETVPKHFKWTREGSECAFFKTAVQGWDIAREQLRKALATNKNIIITGGARRGKTSLAMLAMHWIIKRGKFTSCSAETILEWRKTAILPPQVTMARGARFLPVALLKEQTPTTIALREEAIAAPFLVFDDFGAELDSAPLGSGWITSRIALSKAVVERRSNRDKRMLTTTGFPRETIAALYGDGVAGRLFENANVIDLGMWPEDGAQ